MPVGESDMPDANKDDVQSLSNPNEYDSDDDMLFDSEKGVFLLPYQPRVW